jgi:hypothetical protein
VKKQSIILALLGCLVCSPVYAKTFVGVLWPMFGPLPAIGLVELAAEIRMMPDVEVTTYLHQEWPTLVEDLQKLPKGTRTVIIGYSLGANATAFVANKTYVDLIIALQPSMLSWNPAITGKVGRMIEVYNPNPLLTFGGMGSKKLIGPNIEYVENTDSHPGAQFNGDFRDMVKAEIAKMTASGTEIAQADAPQQPKPSKPEPVTADLAKPRPKDSAKDLAAFPDILAYTEATQDGVPKPGKLPKPVKQLKPQTATAAQAKPQTATAAQAKPQTAAAAQAKPQAAPAAPPKPQRAAAEPPKPQPGEPVAFIDSLSGSVDSGSLQTDRPLTVEDMVGYAKRTYRAPHGAEASGD